MPSVEHRSGHPQTGSHCVRSSLSLWDWRRNVSLDGAKHGVAPHVLGLGAVKQGSHVAFLAWLALPGILDPGREPDDEKGRSLVETALTRWAILGSNQ